VDRAVYCSRDWNAYDPCATLRLARTAWTEGVADALAELYYKRSVDPGGTGVGVQRCPNGPRSPGAVAGFVMGVAGRGPREFMSRWVLKHITDVSSNFYVPAMTVSQYYRLWHELPPLELGPTGAIYNPDPAHPGSWSIDDLYNYWISNDLVSGVEDDASLIAPHIRIYPNPTSGVLRLETSGRNLSPPFRLQLFDVSGRLVMEKMVSLPPNGLGTSTVRTGGLSSGIYWARVVSGNNKTVGSPTRIAVIR